MKPSIGRVVWFFPAGHHKGDQPNSAQIAFVHSDTCINVGALNANGESYAKTSVRLLAPDEPAPFNEHGQATENFAQWMPYQVQQAEKDKPSGDREPVASAEEPTENSGN